MDTYTATGDTLAVQLYSEKFFLEAGDKREISKDIGPEISNNKKGLTVTSPNSVIVSKRDLVGEAGDKLIMGLLMNLTGAGKKNEETLEDNEEQLVFYDQTVTLNLRRNGVRSRDKMSRKRTKAEFRASAYVGLSGWAGKEQDTDAIIAGSGLANEVETIAAVAPSTNRKFKGGQTSAGTINSVDVDADINVAASNLFGTEVISLMKRKAELAIPRIVPVKTEYGEYFKIYIHPYQMKALRAESAWQQAQREANFRGWKNPMFSGIAGLWDGVVVKVTDKIETRLGAGGSTADEYFELGDDLDSGISAARALFCGGQAIILVEGQKPEWIEENFDYKAKRGVAVEVIYQFAKARFNSEDLGLITCDTAIVLDS